MSVGAVIRTGRSRGATAFVPATPELVSALGSLRGESLAWRAFAVNAAILVGMFSVYALTPATVSFPIAASELLILVSAIAVSLFMNLYLLRRTFAALDGLMRFMGHVDPLRPGQRASVDRGDAEVAALARTFNDMLERVETERRESARRVLGAQEDERLRVSRELHDGLGQSLTGVLLLVDEVARQCDDGARDTLEDVREATRSSLEEIRRVARDLRPEALDDLGLRQALETLCTTVASHSGLTVRRRLPEHLPPLTLEQELVVYRVVQEAMTNAVRHAHADALGLELGLDDGHLRAQVTDDGQGFVPEDSDGGVTGMRERALLVQGRVEVDTAPGRGTTVTLCLPLEHQRS